MLISSPLLPFIPSLVIDTGRGKRSCYLDLTEEAGRAGLDQLLRDADVFVQGYRPGGLDARGFSAEACAERRPGLVYVSLSAYGHTGPWSGKRGFDSLVQTATGLNLAESEAAGDPKGTPRPLPAQALDHAAGYLMALGAMAALLRRAEEGGSWHVRVSLAQAGAWLRGLGQAAGGLAAPDQTREEIADLLEESESGFGLLSAVSHAARLEATPARWERPAVPLGNDAPVW